MESVACNTCYLFSMRLLQQCGEDVRSAESIIGSLKTKVIDLKERMHTCMTEGDKTLIVSGCGKAPACDYQHCVYFYYHSAQSLTHRQYE